MSSPAPPTGSATSFDLVRSFRVLFDDPDWVKKTLLGSLFVALTFVLIGVFFVAGYMVRLVRNAARGESSPLPDWDDLGGLFQDGLAPVGAYIVYMIGLTLIPASIGCVIGLAAGGLSSMGSSSAEAFAEGGVAVGVAIFYLLMMVMGLLLFAFFPAALTRLALEQRFSAAFEFGAIFGYIRRNAGSYLLALVAYLVASIASQFGILLLCIGLFPAVFWSYTVLGWGLGEAARLDPGA